jgi:NAD(P)-dependent dehydrogenase (short-subunit alcohol dehydrogenase family)
MRTALITGGTGGLGVAVVETFIAAGWRVVVPWAVRAELERLPEREGLELVPADLTDPDEVARAVRTATSDREAPLGAVVNLVGGFAAGQPVAETPWHDFERLITLNLRPAYEVTHAALPALAAAGGGAVVCVSARSATHPFAGAAAYCASKAAVLTFSQVVALEGRSDGIRCNAILPRKIDTPANRAANPDDPDVGTAPEAVARTILFLCGEDSGAVTGAAVPV